MPFSASYYYPQLFRYLDAQSIAFAAIRLRALLCCPAGHHTQSSCYRLNQSMSHYIIRASQIRALQEQLEFVTNQHFQFRIVQNDDSTLLCAWQNDTHVDYLLHVMMHSDHSFQVALAVQKYRDIETRFDRRLSQQEILRLFSNPRECVCYLVGQRIDITR